MADEATIQDPDFDKFFDELAKLKPGDPIPAPTPVEPVTEPVVAETPATTETPATGVPAGEVPATGVGGEPVTEPVIEPAPAPTDNTALERLADLIAQRQPAPVRQAAPAPRPLLSDEQLEKLQTFQRDYPDIAEAFGLALQAQMAQNNAFIFNEVASVVGPQREAVQTVQVNQQLSDLRQAIPDYDKVRDPVIAWARSESHPDYLRAAYDSVIQQGDVNQIAHLVGTWRSATGQSAAPVSSAPQPRAPAKANELSPAAKQAAASLAPVNSLRTAQVPSEPVGFDDAFELYAKAKK